MSALYFHIYIFCNNVFFFKLASLLISSNFNEFIKVIENQYIFGYKKLSFKSHASSHMEGSFN